MFDNKTNNDKERIGIFVRYLKSSGAAAFVNIAYIHIDPK